MVLAPAANLTFGIAIIVPLIIGLVVGIIIKSAIKIGIALAFLIIILIALGILTPDQVLKPIISLASSSGTVASKVQEIAGYLPYSSVTFLIGLAIGFLKG
jgi:hypothetical protein